MKQRRPIRQGDILLIPVAKREVPKGLTAIPRDRKGRLVLAEGEVTNHCHAILDHPVTLFRQADLDEMADRFLRVEQEVELVHEEHATLTVPEGDWIVRHKREYQPEAIVRVTD